MKHLMVDLETFDVVPEAVFISIAAVQFDLETGSTGHEFYRCVDLEDSLKYGRSIGANTLKWWLEQDASVLRQNFINTYDVDTVLLKFNDFIDNAGVEYLWGNSASFDLGILRHAYRQCSVKPYWKHWNERCYRTIKGLLEDPNPQPNPKPHDPIADCHNQIASLCRRWNSIKE